MMFPEAFQRKNLPSEGDTLGSLRQNVQASPLPQNAIKELIYVPQYQNPLQLQASRNR